MSPKRKKEADWRMIRVPKELAEHLDIIRARMMVNHAEGRSQLPNEFCDRIPPHYYVISKAIEMMEDHRKRSSGKKGSEEAETLLAKFTEFEKAEGILEPARLKKKRRGPFIDYQDTDS